MLKPETELSINRLSDALRTSFEWIVKRDREDAINDLGDRSRILPPKEVEVEMERGQDPHLLHAIGLAWRWRQLIERGEVTTLADLAAKECFSDRYVSRIIRLAWLSS